MNGNKGWRIRFAGLVAFFLVLTSCAAPNGQRFARMSPGELDAYNAGVPDTERVTCITRIRPDTVSLEQTVCSANQQRLARLTRSAGSTGYSPGFSPVTGLNGGSSSSFQRRGNLPRIHFSRPPPGYDRPVIHVLDSRRF